MRLKGHVVEANVIKQTGDRVCKSLMEVCTTLLHCKDMSRVTLYV